MIFECNEGYFVAGVTNSAIDYEHFQSNTSIQEWTQQTVRCVEGKDGALEWASIWPLRPCNHIQCPLPAPIRMATLDMTQDLFKFGGGKLLTVRCDEGYRLEQFEANSTMIICGPDGKWAPQIKACIGMKLN